jgi:hypothetical protein
MKESFNLEKVPIKYILGTYRDDPGYPNGKDILYLMTKRASDKGKPLNPVTFTTTVLLKVLTEGCDDQMMKSLNELEESEFITKGRETKTGTSFTILKNPFI